MRPPKLLQPRPMAARRRPDAPRLRISKVRLPCSERQQPGNILATFGWLVKVEHGPDGHDTCRVYPLVALIIVPLDMHEVHRRRDTGDLIYVARIGPQILVVDHPPDVQLEVPV